MSDLHILRCTERRSQLNHRDSQPPSSYWDKPSKIWLTKRALKELNRRNNKPNNGPPPYRRFRRPLTRSLLTKWTKGQQSISEILNKYSKDDFEELKRFSKLGGPDTSDLRGYLEPINPLEHSTMPPTNRLSVSKNTDATITAKTESTGPYSRNFEQILVDNGIFPPLYKYPDGRRPEKPKNIEEIKERAEQRRSSLSPSRYTDEEFEEFQYVAAKSSDEDHVSRNVVNTIEGSTQEAYTFSSKVKFANFQSLIDYPLTPGNPDLYDGAPPEQLDRRVRDRLYRTIIPSSLETHPIAPNFFLHLKGFDGTIRVAQRQCVYDGALGERGQHQLRSYGTNEANFDNNAHTITSVYLYSALSIYTVYTTQTSNRQKYYTYPIGSWAMAGDIETFRRGTAAFRNLRDWAKEQRDEAIGLANSIADQIESENNPSQWDAEPALTSNSISRSPNDSANSPDGQVPARAKRPSLASNPSRPSKRTKTTR
ncbi:hypothetical protein EV356DRAFT_512731 [Viridothelium virens]|uniref:DUF7924 domain-containing protein n=1 Tax=Viridothelium virens TaxID=1048519 RepID=A0A6A6HED9_VIRVR|nr:hypothetical protein EV356DRAFT_512731 [Viridothelium virens]